MPIPQEKAIVGRARVPVLAFGRTGGQKPGFFTKIQRFESVELVKTRFLWFGSAIALKSEQASYN
ncbi:hypothetical protein QUB63_02875 [Microcoleus sp. ARI1-B5]|uniref:hypothetical protein n=1 Tax=unclassified Microcoleus TaxID=2642155 RepID=UPI002FD59ED7